MKKEYDLLEIDVVCFENEDIVTTSGTNSGKSLMDLALTNQGENSLSFTDFQ